MDCSHSNTNTDLVFERGGLSVLVCQECNHLLFRLEGQQKTEDEFLGTIIDQSARITALEAALAACQQQAAALVQRETALMTDPWRALQNILERNHQMTADNGRCPWCSAEEYGIDKTGDRVSGEAGEFRTDHEEYCAVTLIEAVLAGRQAAPVAAGLTAADLALLYDTADVLNSDSSSARDVAMGIELQALAARLEAAESEASDG